MSIVSYHSFYPDENVRTTPQRLSERQKAQARKNIGAASANQTGGGGLTPEQAQKLSEIDSKLDQSQLQAAIDQALLQAGQSGQFDGQTPQLRIGTVTTLEPGAKVMATITGPTENLKLNLGIPRGRDGNTGKTGGYYTPKVEESTPGAYQITFKASAPDMPAVGPVQLTLPGAKPTGIPVKAMTAGTSTLEPDTEYIWGEVGALTLDFAPAPEDGLSHDYIWQFFSGASATTLNLPGDIKWAGGTAPTIQPGKTYHMMLHNGGAFYAEF